jgi:hypothetical protein
MYIIHIYECILYLYRIATMPRFCFFAFLFLLPRLICEVQELRPTIEQIADRIAEQEAKHYMNKGLTRT